MEKLTLPRAALAAAFLALAGAILLNAWVCDDAYITFRVVDNAVHGYGLRWNVNERVQAYTHPLWMLLHIPFYALWDNIFLITIGLGMACSLAAVAVALATFQKPPLTAAACFLLPLALSKSFVEFSTSGLENPLSFLLFAVFGFVVIRQHRHRHFWFYCSLAASLAMLNRLDTALLYIPPLLYLALARRDTRWKQIFLGALPLIAWFAFSLFYYGFLFPNTKYAKLNTGIPAWDYAIQGTHYLADFFSSDAISCMLMFTVAVTGAECWKDRRIPGRPFLAAAGLGVMAYIGYVVYVGGDFMSGRFWTLPFFVSLWLLYAYVPPMGNLRLFGLIVFIAALKYLSFGIAETKAQQCNAVTNAYQKETGESYRCLQSGITDEHFFYAWSNALFRDGNIEPRPGDNHYLLRGLKARKNPDMVHATGVAGMYGYYAGPRITAIDFNGLADPLLARLPVEDPHNWRIGHFEREVPKGYAQALMTGDMKKMDPDLAEYYRPLRQIISGDLLDGERLKTIVWFNLGVYDHWKESYLERHAR